jgi:hypothetical protein
MSERRSIVAVLVTVLVLTGCGKKPTVVGKWKVAPEVVSSQPAGLPPGFMTGFASTFKYEFKEGGAFEGSMSEGNYTLDGNKVSMTTTKLMGKDISAFGGSAAKPQMTGDLSADGETLTLHPPTMKGIPAAALANIKMVRDKS